MRRYESDYAVCEGDLCGRVIDPDDNTCDHGKVICINCASDNDLVHDVCRECLDRIVAEAGQ